MAAMSKEAMRRLGRLRPGLEARKHADAARCADALGAVERIEAAMRAIEMRLVDVAAALDPEDLAARGQFESWRAAERERLKAMETRRRQAEALLETARDALARSNGEVEALKRLLGETPI